MNRQANAVIAPTNHAKLLAWVDECARLCKPEHIYWATGTQQEYQDMLNLLVKGGTAKWLNKDKRPNSILCWSDPGDVARVEDRTFVCPKNKDEAGPNNNWRDPAEMKAQLRKLYEGCMRGRTMYVIPFSMGPIGSPIAHIGVEISDSPYVVANMRIMTRIGTRVLQALGTNGHFVACLHSIGYPLVDAQGNRRPDVAWPCDATNKFITHYPETKEIWSYGSGYGGNALLGKKCFALRIASIMAREEGWMAEHMLILKLTSPQGKVHFVAAAFPSACGKTNLAMMEPTIPGWKVECVGDDIAWMKFAKDKDGKLRLNAIKTVNKNAVFTNCALTDDGDVWWEDMGPPPAHAKDWKGKDWTPASADKAAHPNARFTVPAAQCPVIASEWEDPRGVPIDAILFGGRRAGVVPLVTEALNWRHGTFLGAIMASEMTAAAAGTVGKLRRDPMAMLPFCGYHMADYWTHWLKVGETKGAQLPRIFYVNWFRKGDDGKFMWPGYGENSRVLKWVVERCEGAGKARLTPIGHLPSPADIDTAGLSIDAAKMQKLLEVDTNGWLAEIPSIHEHFKEYGDRVPQGLRDELAALEQRLQAAK